jgi:hypothetical protein
VLKIPSTQLLKGSATRSAATKSRTTAKIPGKILVRMHDHNP